jgi:hypothetical protein
MTELPPPTRQTRLGSASSVFMSGGFLVGDVCLGSRHSNGIDFIREGELSSVFSMKTIIGFFRYTTRHLASVLNISQEKNGTVKPL